MTRQRPVRDKTVTAARAQRRGLPPGLSTCQIDIIDTVAGQFDFPRLALAVR